MDIWNVRTNLPYERSIQILSSLVITCVEENIINWVKLWNKKKTNWKKSIETWFMKGKKRKKKKKIITNVSIFKISISFGLIDWLNSKESESLTKSFISVD